MFFFALFVTGCASTIVTALPWEYTWSELIIDDFEAVDHKQLYSVSLVSYHLLQRIV